MVTPRAASRRGTLRLMPRSSAATVNRCSPSAATVYGSRRGHLGGQVGADHLRRRPAPARSSAAGSRSTLETPTRIAPRSRRCRVSARVSTPLMPTTPSAASRSSRSPVARQFDGRPGRVAHHVAGDPDPVRLVVLVVDAGVADVRRGLHHHLPVVGRVGQRLLVAGHAGGEDRLAEGLARRCRTPRRGTSARPPGPGSPVAVALTCTRLSVQHRRLAAQERRHDPAGQRHARRTGCCGCGWPARPARPSSGRPGRPG